VPLPFLPYCFSQRKTRKQALLVLPMTNKASKGGKKTGCFFAYGNGKAEIF